MRVGLGFVDKKGQSRSFRYTTEALKLQMYERVKLGFAAETQGRLVVDGPLRRGWRPDRVKFLSGMQRRVDSAAVVCDDWGYQMHGPQSSWELSLARFEVCQVAGYTRPGPT